MNLGIIFFLNARFLFSIPLMGEQDFDVEEPSLAKILIQAYEHRTYIVKIPKIHKNYMVIGLQQFLRKYGCSCRQNNLPCTEICGCFVQECTKVPTQLMIIIMKYEFLVNK
jgi:hypothetical protein